MTKSELLISESKAIVCNIRDSHPALATFLELLTEEYRIAVAQAIEAEKTIHRLMKGEQ